MKLKKLIAMLAIVALVFAVVGCSKDDTETPDGNDDEITDDANVDGDGANSDLGATYEGDGFSFDYPEGWTETDLGMEGAVAFMDASGANLMVMNQAGLGGTVSLMTEDMFVQQLEAQDPTGSMTIDKFETTKIDGNNAIQAYYSMAGMVVKQTIIENGSDMFIFQISYMDGTDTDYEGIYESAFKTLKFN